jgi:hypothetical protein
MSARQLIDTAAKAGLSVMVDGPDLVVEADGQIPEALLADLRSHKPELIAELARTGAPPANEAPARFSDLYETEADYARALLRYARQDGLSLTVEDGQLVISIGLKSDQGFTFRTASARKRRHRIAGSRGARAVVRAFHHQR